MNAEDTTSLPFRPVPAQGCAVPNSGGGFLNPQTLRATFGGLLHDVGKLVYRAGEDARDHATSGDAMLRSLLPGKEWSGTA